MKRQEWVTKIDNNELNNVFGELYGSAAVEVAKIRYINAINKFCELFSDGDIRIFSAPGRTEISGNHTDHNNGVVVAASVNLDMLAVVKKTDNDTVTLISEGFGKSDVVNVTETDIVEEEREHSQSLIRGVSSRISALGGNVGGFDAYTTNNVLRGSGLSSSAAFEVCIGQIFNDLFNDGKFTPVEIAQIGQYAENVYFGKPSGLLDQTACAVGGVVKIDFADKTKPEVTNVSFDLESYGLSLCITDTGGNHADLTQHYASIPIEMKSVASSLGKEVLRDVERSDVVAAIPELREKLGDRPILRALHFYEECDRATAVADALKANDLETFFKLIIESGHSSFEQVQNAYVPETPSEQNIPLALALSLKLLSGKGAFRLQGGGFAGTIQAFVPNEIVEEYVNTLEGVFGKGSCHRLIIRGKRVCEVTV